MSVNGILVEEKMRRFKDECAHFSFKKYPIYTHDGASAKFTSNSHENGLHCTPFRQLKNVVYCKRIMNVYNAS
jgi:hypothetical protein